MKSMFVVIYVCVTDECDRSTQSNNQFVDDNVTWSYIIYTLCVGKPTDRLG